ncbi:MAG: hypothetical protein Q7T55_12210 [Solirubrobacteraceae bacterium]|nr:hypothetical protein [Solirubrobacteraceae bacterium]
MPAALSWAPAASAGSYTVWSCHDGNWNSAPTDGWTPTNEFRPTGAANTNDSCSLAAGSLSSAITGAEGSRLYAPMRVGWTYSAPADVTVASVDMDTAWGIGADSGDDNAHPALAISRAGLLTGRTDPNVVAGCFSLNCNRVPDTRDVFVPVGRTFGVTIACLADEGVTGSPSCRGGGGGRAHLYMRRARLTMTEDLAPTASALDEAALGTQPLSGVRTLKFNAYDKGSGLYAAEVRLGGKVVWGRSVMNENGGACTAALKASGFRGGMPCQPGLPLSFPIDTTAVADGTHQLTVTLWDAADNQATVIDRSVTVQNGAPAPTPTGPVSGAPNGTGGSLATARFASKKTQSTRSTTYGRKVSLADQLVDAKGKAIVGAQVDVYETRGGERAQKVATVTSDGRGKIRHRPATTSPGLIEFAYAPATGSTSYVARRSVRLRVAAAVTLRTSVRDVRRRAPVRFSGTVRAGTIPKGGLQVAIETRGPSGWRGAKIVNTDAKGRFAWSYRFQLAARWQFRARVMRSSELAVQPGTSPTVKIRVRS